MSLKQSLLTELSKGPRTVKQLRSAVGADGKKITKALKSLAEENKVEAAKGVFSLRQAPAPLVEATLVKLGRAFGFASATDGSGDIFIPGHSLAGAMPGDRMMVMLNPYPRRAGTREGEVYSIVQRKERVTGTVEKQGGGLVLVPDNAPETPLRIQKSADGGVKPGEKAAGVILAYGERHDEHEVGITLRFGSADSARQCAKAILYAAGIEKSFGPEVKAEAKKVSAEKITKEDIKSRKDLRKDIIFTIDDASTKDIDDAISVKKFLNGYVVGVHIADVSHYVKAKSPLDSEALARGTSIYYADSVIPMLPRQLSNGICSLNPDEDRLAFSCILTLDHDGTMLDYRFYKTVVRSRLKGVYSEINQIWDGTADEDLLQKYEEVAGALSLIEEVYEKLAALRRVRGSMEIESDEAKLVLDAEGRCVDVQKRARGKAERVIEEFMLLANNAAAHQARRAELPFIYRVHEKPGAERVENLKALLTAMGVDYHFAGPVPTQVELSELLDKTRGTPAEMPVHTGVLRSMAKALYEEEPKGHFGLALQDYAHFTSPIRRYPDLAIHRILTDFVGGAAPAQIRKRYKNFVGEASRQSSLTEQQAQQIERDCDDCYKAEYMHTKIGEVYEGVISSVVPFGVYVSLENTIEGLIHITNLSEHRLDLVPGVAFQDPVTKQSFRLGSVIRVRVAGVNVSQGNVDFVPEKE